MAVKESADGISAAMKSLSITYARYVNRANGLTGKRFQGRFKSIPFDSEKDARAAAKSLDLNPVKPVNKSEPKPKAEKKADKKPLKPAVKPKQEEQSQKPAVKKKNLPSWLL